MPTAIPNNDCQTLKNLRYKTMLMTGNKNKLTSSVTNDMSDMNLILENESQINKKESWNKLDKSIKTKKISEHIKLLASKHKLNTAEISNLSTYLISQLDKKNFTRNKDVIYNKEVGVLESIPMLQFNNGTRKFLLKKVNQHVSTAKCLGPKRKNKSKTNKKDL